MQYQLVLFNSDNIGPLPSAMNSEVAAIVHDVQFNEKTDSYRRNLSKQFRALFEAAGWEKDTTLHFEEARDDTPHFMKNRILVQISWRHYGMIGTELLKFQTEYLRENIAAGVYICISSQLLDFFNQNPDTNEGRKSFKGSITMSRARQYLEYVSETINVPIALMGLLPPKYE